MRQITFHQNINIVLIIIVWLEWKSGSSWSWSEPPGLVCNSIKWYEILSTQLLHRIAECEGVEVARQVYSISNPMNHFIFREWSIRIIIECEWVANILFCGSSHCRPHYYVQFLEVWSVNWSFLNSNLGRISKCECDSDGLKVLRTCLMSHVMSYNNNC